MTWNIAGWLHECIIKKCSNVLVLYVEKDILLSYLNSEDYVTSLVANSWLLLHLYFI